MLNNIRKFRTVAKLKQADLAKSLNVGATTISNWEIGYTEPDFDSLRKMADLFSCSIDELLGAEKAPTVKNDGERTVLDITSLSPENRDRLEDYLHLLLDSQNK